jgi:hypothetical protein
MRVLRWSASLQTRQPMRVTRRSASLQTRQPMRVTRRSASLQTRQPMSRHTYVLTAPRGLPAWSAAVPAALDGARPECRVVIPVS